MIHDLEEIKMIDQVCSKRLKLLELCLESPEVVNWIVRIQTQFQQFPERGGEGGSQALLACNKLPTSEFSASLSSAQTP